MCTVLTASVLAGCGGGSSNSGSGTSEKDTSDMIYSAKSLNFGDSSFNAENIISLGNSGDALFAVSDNQDSSGGTDPKIYIFTEDGEVTDTISIPAEDTQDVSVVAATDDGFVIALTSYMVDSADTGTSAQSSGTESAAVQEDGEDSITGTFYLLYLSRDGEQKWKTQLTGDADGNAIESITNLMYADGNLYLGTSSGLTQISTDDGTPVKQVYKTQDSDADQYFPMKDGKIAVLQYTDDGQQFAVLDSSTGKTGDDAVSIPSNIYMQNAFPGRGDDIYVASDSGIYKADMDAKSFMQILDFVASDLNATSVSALAAVDDTTLAAALTDYDGNAEMDLLTKVDPSDQKNKTSITVGCYSLDYSVRKAIVAFNQEHDDVQIKIKDYTSYDSDDGTEGISQLNTDIVSGNAPDIMILDNDMPVSSYIEKGVLLPLDDYIDSDSDIQSGSYLTNVFDAFKTDGKTYQIIPAFSLETVAGKTSDIGDGKNLSIDAVLSLSKQKNVSSAYLFGLYDQDSLLSTALSFVGNEYVDLKDKKSTFDSDSFQSILGLVKDCPKNISDDQYSEDSSTFYRSGKSLFYISDLTSFGDYQTITQGMFGDTVTFTGFPTETNSGTVIRPQMRMAISASTKEKDACWQFLKYFLTDDFQSKVEDNYVCWPVSVKAIDALGEEAKKNPTYEDENGNQVEYPNEYYLGTETIELKPLTDAEVEDVKNILKSASAPLYYDSNVEKIISEETGAYFEGQKTVQEVTDVIQNRVTTYIKENN